MQPSPSNPNAPLSLTVRKNNDFFFFFFYWAFSFPLLPACLPLLASAEETADALHVFSSASDWQAVWKMPVLERPEFSGFWMLIGHYFVQATDSHFWGVFSAPFLDSSRFPSVMHQQFLVFRDWYFSPFCSAWGSVQIRRGQGSSLLFQTATQCYWHRECLLCSTSRLRKFLSGFLKVEVKSEQLKCLSFYKA